MFPFKELHFPPCCLLLPLKYYYLPEMVGHPLKVSAIIYYVILSITQPGRSSSFITLTDLNYRRIYLLPLFVLKTNLSIIPPSFRPVTLIKMFFFFFQKVKTIKRFLVVTSVYLIPEVGLAP